MPKLNFQIREESLAGETVVHVYPRGFVDSSNCSIFEEALDRVAKRSARFALLDLSRVHYVNSTGISIVIRHFGVYREREGLLSLVAVPKSIGVSMHLLGVTSLIPFHKSADAAFEEFGRVLDGSFKPVSTIVSESESATADEPKTRVFVPVRRRRSPLKEARILLLLPKPTRLARVLKLRYGELNGNFCVHHDARSALESIDEKTPDLVVVDERLDIGGEFTTRLKLHPERSLISVIKLYGKDARAATDLEFKIWENDYLEDPFDIFELYSLSEAELIRVPKDRKVFQQQVRIQFRTRKELLERAAELCDHIIRGALDDEEDRTAMFAAVKEGIDNAILHGNRWAPEKAMDINFLVDRKKLTVIIEDQGRGFDFEYYMSRLDDHDTFERAKKRILEEGHRGGLGILLMHRCTDRLDYSGVGNILRLEKNLQ